MSVNIALSNHFMYQMITGSIDLDNDTVKAILMSPSFVFDEGTHDILSQSDITTNKLAAGGGYDVLTIENIVITQDNVNNKIVVTWDQITWIGESGGFGPVSGCLFYDDTTGDDTVIGYINFNDPTSYTVNTDEIFRPTNTGFEVAQ